MASSSSLETAGAPWGHIEVRYEVFSTRRSLTEEIHVFEKVLVALLVVTTCVWDANAGGLHHDTDFVFVCFPCIEANGCSRPTVPSALSDEATSFFFLGFCGVADGVLLVHRIGGVFPRCTAPPKSSMPGDKETRRFTDRGSLFILLLRYGS
mmetsp:Transcript_65004/g.172049  ORF Transcript_65004/g.172049 Transcript_65004/m.172049 type:complete len:152 (+) Transcript_65004:1692-2147(+)